MPSGNRTESANSISHKSGEAGALVGSVGVMVFFEVGF